MKLSKRPSVLLLCLAGLATGSVLIFLVHDTARKPSLRVGASWKEYGAYIRAEETSAKRWRLPRKDFIAVQGRPWQQMTVTHYYFRDRHYFLTRCVGFEFTNGILVRVESPYWRWHFDL